MMEYESGDNYEPTCVRTDESEGNRLTLH